MAITQPRIFRAKVRSPSYLWVETMARVGYAAKGAVYFVIGALAVQLAAGGGGDATGSRGAVREIANQPFGEILLWITGIGLFAYAGWRFIQAATDPDGVGSDAKGSVKRAGYFVSGLIHSSLGAFALRLATGSGGAHADDSQSQQQLTAAVLSQPLGQWLVLAAGLIVVGVGVAQFYRAYSEDFMRRLGGMSTEARKWAKRAGKWGFSARGVVFLMIGWFLIKAAAQADSSEARGLEGALEELARQSHGPWLLGIVAAGLGLYGVFMFITARYRRISV